MAAQFCKVFVFMASMLLPASKSVQIIPPGGGGTKYEIVGHSFSVPGRAVILSKVSGALPRRVEFISGKYLPPIGRDGRRKGLGKYRRQTGNYRQPP